MVKYLKYSSNYLVLIFMTENKRVAYYNLFFTVNDKIILYAGTFKCNVDSFNQSFNRSEPGQAFYTLLFSTLKSSACQKNV